MSKRSYAVRYLVCTVGRHGRVRYHFLLDSRRVNSRPSLGRDLTVDVVVIGGGLAGTTAAYLLKLAGLSVALVERDRLARVDTGHTTAHLTMVTDVQLNELVENFGEEAARAVLDAGRIAVDQIESHVLAEDIDCDFRRRGPQDGTSGRYAAVLRGAREDCA